MNYSEVAKTLQDHLEGTGGIWDWDNYISYEKFSDPYLLEVQQRMNILTTGFPARNSFLRSDSDHEISNYILELRRRATLQDHN